MPPASESVCLRVNLLGVARSFHDVLPGLPANSYTEPEGRVVTVSTGMSKGHVEMQRAVVPELATKCLDAEASGAAVAAVATSSCRLEFPDGVVHRPGSVPELLTLLSSSAGQQQPAAAGGGGGPRLFQGAFDGADLSSNVRNRNAWVDVASITELHLFEAAADGTLRVGVQTPVCALMTKLGQAIAERLPGAYTPKSSPLALYVGMGWAGVGKDSHRACS